MARRNRRNVRRAPRRRKAKIARSLKLKSQMATITESYEYLPLAVNSLTNCVFQLSQFPRASTVAACYKWYKPLSVTWEFTPYFNTFQAGSTGYTATCPTFYSYMNRTQDGNEPIGAPQQLAYVLSTGAKPRMFNKKMVIKYRPNWCSPGLASVGVNPVTGAVQAFRQQGLKCEYAWLASPNQVPKGISGSVYAVLPQALELPLLNPTVAEFDPTPLANLQVNAFANATIYNGHNVLVSQDRAGLDNLICDVRVTVKWAFKDPNPQFYDFEVRDPRRTGENDLSGASIV